MTGTNDRPLLTFALFAYNQERFIADAVQGALSQTYSPLEVILSDDCSSDRTFEIMQELAAKYQGPHRVLTNRTSSNLGIGRHVNQVMAMAQGQYIVVAAGDDISLPQRTEKIWDEYLASGCTAHSIFSNEYLIDASGRRRAVGRQAPPDPETLTLHWFVQHRSWVMGSSHAWHRNVFDVFGPLNDEVVSEDSAIPFRSLLLGSIRYIHEPLVLRRFTGSNISMRGFTLWSESVNGKRYRAYAIHQAKNYAAVFQTYKSDIVLFESIFPEKRAELKIFHSMIDAQLSRLFQEVRFWKASPSGKLKIIFRDYMQTGKWRTAARLFITWVAPALLATWQHLFTLKNRGRLPQSEY
jgi:glycosyltransferase involved in cell wall biosynthesis